MYVLMYNTVHSIFITVLKFMSTLVFTIITESGLNTVILELISDLFLKYTTLFPAPGGSYIVLGTDYESYASVYSCDIVFGKKTFYIWLLTRDQFPSSDTVSFLLEVKCKYY